MKLLSIEQEFKNNAYPGRGIILGKSRTERKRSRHILSWAAAKLQPEPCVCGRRRRDSHTGI